MPKGGLPCDFHAVFVFKLVIIPVVPHHRPQREDTLAAGGYDNLVALLKFVREFVKAVRIIR